jgi:Leucine Rich repeat
VPVPDQSPAVAFERGYRALCNLNAVAAHQPLVDAVAALIAEGKRVLDLNALPFVSARCKPPFDLRTALRALRFDRHFEALLLRDQPWKEMVSCVAEVMQYNTTLGKLALTNLETHEGFAALGEALQVNNQHRISELELSLNKVGSDLLTLAPALQAAPLGMRRLLLNGCEVNAKTGVVLFASLKESAHTSARLEELALSHNDLGPAASASLGAWLASMAGVSHLQRLLLRGASVDVTLVCESARTGLAASLQELDLAHNRVDVRAAQAIGALIKASQALRLLSVSGCRVRVDALAALLTSAGDCNYPHVDLSHNELAHGGSKHVAELARLIAANRCLYSLDLSHNHLKNDYLARLINEGVCASASLRRVHLSCNGSKGSKWKLLLAALQSLLSSATLEALSLAGDGSKFCYGEKLSALFPAVESSKLLYLDLSGNRLGERVGVSVEDGRGVYVHVRTFVREGECVCMLTCE